MSSTPLVTVFAVCKPFTGHVRVIQRNAIESWARLRPDVEVILFGDEDGIAEAAADFSVRHVPEVGRNKFGTPLMSELFSAAKAHTKSPFLAYVNADIMLITDFVESLRRIKSPRFLMAGRRWNVDITERWDFEAPDWEARLRDHVKTHGELFDPAAIDYFAFPRSMYDGIPAFALGRNVFDNWMIYHARETCAAMVDASHAVMAIHQNHDYSHHAGGVEYLRHGEEAQTNRKLAGADQWGEAFLFTLGDATSILTESGEQSTMLRERQRHLVTAPVLYPKLRPIFRTTKYLKGLRNGAMRRLGLLTAKQR